MADNSLYTNIGGANELLRRTRLLSNNLANANTIGFHADFGTIKSRAVNGDQHSSRIIPTVGQTYTNHRPGPISFTGRPLDVAIDGEGFIAVQSKLGKIGCTRAGNFEITSQGLLVTKNGDMILGQNGVINIPPASEISIDRDGVVSARLKGEPASSIAEIGQIKLVNPDITQLKKGEDGLFYLDSGNLVPSTEVVLVPESVEGSNVDPVSSLVELVDLSRQFDFQTKLMHVVDENATKANGLLDIQK